MKVSITEALKIGVKAIQDGETDRAQRIFATIRETQPDNPEANFNLGELALGLGESKDALSYLDRAFKVEPNRAKYRISYIDALIKNDQLEKANQLLTEGKELGMNGEKATALEVQLSSKSKTAQIIPSNGQLKNLLVLYENRQFSEAEELALSITQEFPEHQFGWKVLGALFEQSGRKQDALQANQTSVRLQSKDPEAHNNLGNTYQELSRLKEAEASYTQAIALKPDLAEAHYNLGNTLKGLDRMEEAGASYIQAIALKPEIAEAHSNLGVTLRELGRLEDAIASLRDAISLRPHYAEAHVNLAITLKDLGRFDEAQISYTQAIALNPDLVEARYNLGVMLFERQQHKAAAEQFDGIEFKESKIFSLRCSYLERDEITFNEKLDSAINDGELNAVIGSLVSCAEARFGSNRSNPFCNDPLKYIAQSHINKSYDFRNIFVKTAIEVLNDSSLSTKSQGNLTNGIQTSGNFFLMDRVMETEIETIIRNEVEEYRNRFKDSDEGFIKNWPPSYDIRGWLVSMQKGGKLASHIHGIGWITGSIYINVPPKLKSGSGNLVLCMDDLEEHSEVDSGREIIIDVTTGSLCFFPSSLHHYTIPFEEEEDRIVLAFDVVPRG